MFKSSVQKVRLHRLNIQLSQGVRWLFDSSIHLAATFKDTQTSTLSEQLT